MQHSLYTPGREISSSQDHCRCETCRNLQQEHKTDQRQNISNIYILRHLKKRGGPPIKKQCFIKELSGKGKFNVKKQDLEKRSEQQKGPATPLKHKFLETIRAKQTGASSTFIEYHQVSHSQRQKIPSKQPNEGNVEPPRRIINLEEVKLQGFKKRGKPATGSLKIVQVSHNPENIKLRYENSRSVSEASADCRKSLGDKKSVEKEKSG